MSEIRTEAEFRARVDAQRVTDLVAAGSVKWAVPGSLGAGIAEMDFPPAPVITTAVQEAVARGISGYLPPALRSELQQATAHFEHEQHGWDIDPDWVVGVPDVLAGLIALFEHFTPAGGAVIVPTPCYMPFATLPTHYGRRVIEVPMRHDADGWRLDLDDLDAAFAAGGQVLLLTNPHNPIGKVYTRAELEGIAEVVERHHGVVFSDEIHAPLRFGDVGFVPYASLNEVAAAHTLTAFSASKSFNVPGYKCAQLVLTSPLDRERVAAGVLHADPSSVGIVANVAAYQNGWEWLGWALSYLDDNRRALVAACHDLLPEVSVELPDATFLAWLDCRQLGLGETPGEFFAQHAKVTLVDGSKCGAAGAGFVRLNFATPRSILIEMVERMAAAVQGR